MARHGSSNDIVFKGKRNWEGTYEASLVTSELVDGVADGVTVAADGVLSSSNST